MKEMAEWKNSTYNNEVELDIWNKYFKSQYNPE